MDGGHTVIEDKGSQRHLVSDLVVRYKNRITHLEYTGGDRICLRAVIQKAAAASHKAFAIVVDGETRPKSVVLNAQQYGLRYIVRSNRQNALAISEKAVNTHEYGIFFAYTAG